jgi:hypothetical protein
MLGFGTDGRNAQEGEKFIEETLPMGFDILLHKRKYCGFLKKIGQTLANITKIVVSLQSKSGY